MTGEWKRTYIAEKMEKNWLKIYKETEIFYNRFTPFWWTPPFDENEPFGTQLIEYELGRRKFSPPNQKEPSSLESTIDVMSLDEIC